jgi:hypothetical protein
VTRLDTLLIIAALLCTVLMFTSAAHLGELFAGAAAPAKVLPQH